MRNSATVAIPAAVRLSLLAASLTAVLTACVGAPNDLGADRRPLPNPPLPGLDPGITREGRVGDQPAAPHPQTGTEAAIPATTSPGPGSFPRSFLIPGSNTSISISGSVDTTIGSSVR
jgi:hypothetical protein